MVSIQLRCLFHVQQIFQTGSEMFHYDENTEVFIALGNVWDDNVEYLRGAEEVHLLLHVL